MKSLTRDEWEEPHNAGALHRGRELALILHAHAGTAAGKYASMRVKKLLEKLGVFVIDVFEFLGFVFLHGFALKRDIVGIYFFRRVLDGVGFLLFSLPFSRGPL